MRRTHAGVQVVPVEQPFGLPRPESARVRSATPADERAHAPGPPDQTPENRPPRVLAVAETRRRGERDPGRDPRGPVGQFVGVEQHAAHRMPDPVHAVVARLVADVFDHRGQVEHEVVLELHGGLTSAVGTHGAAIAPVVDNPAVVAARREVIGEALARRRKQAEAVRAESVAKQHGFAFS